MSGPWAPPAPSLAALPVDRSKTEPKPAYYKLQFGDDVTGFSYYVRTLSVVIGRNCERQIAPPPLADVPPLSVLGVGEHDYPFGNFDDPFGGALPVGVLNMTPPPGDGTPDHQPDDAHAPLQDIGSGAGDMIEVPADFNMDELADVVPASMEVDALEEAEEASGMQGNTTPSDVAMTSPAVAHASATGTPAPVEPVATPTEPPVVESEAALSASPVAPADPTSAEASVKDEPAAEEPVADVLLAESLPNGTPADDSAKATPDPLAVDGSMDIKPSLDDLAGLEGLEGLDLDLVNGGDVEAPPPPPVMKTSGSLDHVDVDLGPLKSVSRNHAKIEYRTDMCQFCLEIFGRNGAWVDDRYYVKGTIVPLNQGSQIQIATRIFSFILPPSPDSSPSLVQNHLDAAEAAYDYNALPYPYNLPPDQVGYNEFYGEGGPGPASAVTLAARVPAFNAFAASHDYALGEGTPGFDDNVWADEWGSDEESSEDSDNSSSDEDEDNDEQPVRRRPTIKLRTKRIQDDDSELSSLSSDPEPEPAPRKSKKKDSKRDVTTPVKAERRDSGVSTPGGSVAGKAPKNSKVGGKGFKSPALAMKKPGDDKKSKKKKADKVKEEEMDVDSQSQSAEPEEESPTPAPSASTPSKKKAGKTVKEEAEEKPSKETKKESKKKKKAAEKAAAAAAQAQAAAAAAATPAAQSQAPSAVPPPTLAAAVPQPPRPPQASPAAPTLAAAMAQQARPPPPQPKPGLALPTAAVQAAAAARAAAANPQQPPPNLAAITAAGAPGTGAVAATQVVPGAVPAPGQVVGGAAPGAPGVPGASQPGTAAVRPPPQMGQPGMQVRPPHPGMQPGQPGMPQQPGQPMMRPPMGQPGQMQARPPVVRGPPPQPEGPPRPYYISELKENPTRAGHILCSVPIPPSGAGPRPPPQTMLGLDGKPFIGPPPLKPTATFATIIHRALVNLPRGRGTLGEVCNWVAGEWEWFRLNPEAGWQNSIRHNLSLNKAFLKVPRIPEDDPESKGSVWILDPEEGPLFEEKQRRDALKSEGKAKNAEEKRMKERLKAEERARKQREREIQLAEAAKHQQHMMMGGRPGMPARPMPGRPPVPAAQPAIVSANRGVLAAKAKIVVVIQPITPPMRAKSVIDKTDSSGAPLPFVCDGTTLVLEQSTFGHLTTDIIDKLQLLGAAGAVDVLSAWVVNKNKQQAQKAAQAKAAAGTKPGMPVRPGAPVVRPGAPPVRPGVPPQPQQQQQQPQPQQAKPGVPVAKPGGPTKPLPGPAPPGANLTKVIGMIAEVANARGDVNTVGPNASALLRYIRVVGVEIDLRVAERIWATGVVPPLPPKKVGVNGKPGASGAPGAKPGVPAQGASAGAKPAGAPATGAAPAAGAAGATPAGAAPATATSAPAAGTPAPAAAPAVTAPGAGAPATGAAPPAAAAAPPNALKRKLEDDPGAAPTPALAAAPAAAATTPAVRPPQPLTAPTPTPTPPAVAAAAGGAAPEAKKPRLEAGAP